MSRIAAIPVLALILSACAQPTVPAISPPPADSAAILAQIERDTATRWKEKDEAFFADLFLEGFVWLSTVEPIIQTREQYLADMKKPYTIEFSEMDEPTVLVRGTTGVVYGKARNKGTFDGVPFDVAYLYHDTFTWDGKAWKMMATSSVPILKPAPEPAAAPSDPAAQ